MLKPVVLESPHVRLEPYSLSHLEGLIQAASEPRDSFQFTRVPQPNVDDMRNEIDLSLADQAEGKSLPFVIIARDSDEVAGSTKLMNAEYWQRQGGMAPSETPDAIEIGATWLAEKFQRTAVNTEAKLLLLTHSFEILRVKRVTLKTDERNVRSRRNIERVGATLDGVLRSHTFAPDGTIRNSAWYSIVESEWPQVKAALSARLKD